MILTIDSFAWVEIIHQGPLEPSALEAMERAEECVTPSIVLAEVAAKCVRDGLPDRRVREALRAIREASAIAPIDDETAVGAAHALQELRAHARGSKLPPPGLADGLVLATARRSNARLLTGDPHFRPCPETLWLG